MANILFTKLLYPRFTAQYLQRERLIARLNDGRRSGKAVTLISAPAGYGKSVLGGLWVDQLAEPVAWLSLDDYDNEPARFFTYLVATLQQVDESLCWELEKVLRAGELPPEETITSILVNDMLRAEQRFMLVLDDLHVIRDDFILKVLEALMANMPPTLHLTIITREDPPLPLARLRAQNRLSEIRASDLRLHRDEVADFLNTTMGLSLNESDITALKDKTEGWIVGLQLAALAVQQNPNQAPQQITHLSGSHHHILAYFTEEVLQQQPEATRRFLLQTSILERLTGDLCDAVTGRNDGLVQLEQLARANLFLMPLDNARRWGKHAVVRQQWQSHQRWCERLHLG